MHARRDQPQMHGQGDMSHDPLPGISARLRPRSLSRDVAAVMPAGRWYCIDYVSLSTVLSISSVIFVSFVAVSPGTRARRAWAGSRGGAGASAAGPELSRPHTPRQLAEGCL